MASAFSHAFVAVALGKTYTGAAALAFLAVVAEHRLDRVCLDCSQAAARAALMCVTKT
jgi:hypothetical protein